MSDGAFPDRVTLLRNRWEADPSSRIFLQLAEEYRHQGRVREALDVLDRGLKEHPGYLSALVAKGRCHLELGEPEPARTVLERVAKQDATHMVANKLLVRAYLETGEPDRARERLDLYSLLNDSDPEIEELRRRLRAMEQPPQAEKPGSTPPPESSVAEAPSPVPSRRETAPSPPLPVDGGDIFDLGLPTRRAAAAASPEEPFADLLTAAPAVTVAAAAVAAPSPAAAATAIAEAVPESKEELEAEDVLFPGLASQESRQRYLDSLSAEGIFVIDLIPAAPPEPPVAPRMQQPYGEVILARAAPEPLPEEPAAVPEVSWEPLEEIEEMAPLPEPVAEEPEAAIAPREPAAVAAPAERNATATLGELYLKQGHLGEAERIFREVLRREPDSPAAQEGLARAAARRLERRPLAASDLLAGYEPVAGSGAAETRARKAWVLNGYLQRLRRRSQRDVS